MTQNSISILVGSLNPFKINAVKNAFANIFANNQIICEGMHAPSGVSEQPMTASETRLGAINRALFCKNASNNADFYVALEGGVDLTEDGPITCAYFSIINNQQQPGYFKRDYYEIKPSGILYRIERLQKDKKTVYSKQDDKFVKLSMVK